MSPLANFSRSRSPGNRCGTNARFPAGVRVHHTGSSRASPPGEELPSADTCHCEAPLLLPTVVSTLKSSWAEHLVCMELDIFIDYCKEEWSETSRLPRCIPSIESKQLKESMKDIRDTFRSKLLSRY
ncbi:unnamed protein product [Pleuronectes platessa]|uniref:Uncharacterized protein n=1 Tax=Pleuronectes platessa TaxID=8262 RepID=A0A9N7UFN7_PLEPL|nr:unnamed protein product [Pleuronectes platessa]